MINQLYFERKLNSPSCEKKFAELIKEGWQIVSAIPIQGIVKIKNNNPYGVVVDFEHMVVTTAIHYIMLKEEISIDEVKVSEDEAKKLLKRLKEKEKATKKLEDEQIFNKEKEAKKEVLI